MSAGSVAPALPAMGNRRLMRRLWGFTAASIALHAVMILSYAPAGIGGFTGAADGPRVIQAVIAPLPSAGPVGSEAQAMEANGRPAPSSAGEPSPPRPAQQTRTAGTGLPLPDKWYAAAELQVLAEPLSPARLVYPEEFVSQGIVARVRVRLFVDEGGAVRKLEVVESGPEPAFEAAAKKVWEAMRFSPAIKDGVAVKSQKLLELDFLPF